MSSPVLPDVLQDGLRVVFCGTAAGNESAARGAYYAGRGNKFWTILHETGLTPCQLEPEQFERLCDYGLGLTDVCKTASGMDHQILVGAFDPKQLREVIAQCAPLVVAFNGKRAAQLALGVEKGMTLEYGPSPVSLAGVQAWVLPSTSGAAAGNWNPQIWHQLARSLAPPDWPSSIAPDTQRSSGRRWAGTLAAMILVAGACVKLSRWEGSDPADDGPG